MEELRAQRKVLWKQLCSSHSLLVRAHSLCEALETRYNRDKSAYEKCDYQLALLDGRMQRVLASASSSKSKKAPKEITDLTEEQIIKIAKALGIELVSVDEEASNVED